MKRSNLGRGQWQQLLRGRYGADALGRFLAITGAAALLLALLLRPLCKGTISNILLSLALLELMVCYGRVLSKNFSRRQEENRRFMKREWAVRRWFELKRDCFRQRKEYVFFRCPGCSRTVRVPRGKGRVRITCRSCGYSFEKKT